MKAAARQAPTQVRSRPAPHPTTREGVVDVAMTPMQRAYLLGSLEGQELGGQATFLYVDIAMACDAGRAARLVETLFARHDIFTATLRPEEAVIRLDPELPIRTCRVHGPDRVEEDGTPRSAQRQDQREQCDQATQSGQAGSRLIAEVRERLMAEARDCHRTGRLYGAEAIPLADGTSRVCLYASMIIADAVSGVVFIGELHSLLRGEPLPAPARYTNAMHQVQTLAAARADGQNPDPDKAYWAQKAPTLPPAPRFRRGARMIDGWQTRGYQKLLSAELVAGLERRCRQDRTSL